MVDPSTTGNQAAKLAAAQSALREFLAHAESIHANEPSRPILFGIGSGSTMEIFIDLLAEHLRGQSEEASSLEILAVPTSHQARWLGLNSGIPLADLLQYPVLDIAIDGADEIDSHLGIMIKGGGGAHTIEKLVATSARRVLILVDEGKISKKLGSKGKPVPIEVLPMAAVTVANALRQIDPYLQVTVRNANGSGKMGPVVTDSGNLLLDLLVPEEHPLWENPKALENVINNIPGVLDCGVFTGLAELTVIVGRADGSSYPLRSFK